MIVLIIIVAFSFLLHALTIYGLYRLSRYIDVNVEHELDALYDENANLKSNLRIAIREDYLESEETLKVRRPIVSKSENE